MIENLGALQGAGGAENGYEGMLFARDLKPDVIFAEIQMPRVSGSGYDRNLQGHRGVKDYRFVSISGYADFEYAQR